MFLSIPSFPGMLQVGLPVHEMKHSLTLVDSCSDFSWNRTCIGNDMSLCGRASELCFANYGHYLIGQTM